MALLDLSQVTRSLINLIRLRVQELSSLPAGTLSVSPEPPDGLSGSNTIGFYLYHVTEDPYHKNLPPPGSDAVPVRHVPMAVHLYYLLTAHSDSADELGTYQEQSLMGYALKTLHDYPIIDQNTEVNGVKVLTIPLQDGETRLRIALQPIPPEDAVTYWTAGSSPLRLSAYYQVSVALLEPEEPARRAGRVLSYGVHTFAAGAPRLDGSYYILTYTIPGEPGPRQVELRPAQVPIGGTVVFTGSGLSGARTSLLLWCERWQDPVEVDLSWGVTASANQLFATVQPTAGSEVTLPGVYSAVARVVTQRTLPDGRVREFAHASNRSPFVITPRIDTISAILPTGEFTVTGAVFEHVAAPIEDIQVYVGDARLAEGTAGGLAPAEYAVQDASTLDVRLPSGLVSGESLLFRVLVNGAESPPEWIVVP
jgi:hypothetical protein